ncbi:hypothetical protein LTR97_007531 [Elasticomyces elasticus]|uniref:DUF7918 domain-containing protein n=1 Tax=Elasticomyces elasticus TaxID=574655 RepID=A0AAN7VR22_9PEZI|nr:hypothetical protein LTR97_007531 [Elasticomyces elasticus]
MAIHPDLPGLEITVDVNGQPLPEFDEHKSETYKTKAHVKYVEVVSGAEFGIGIKYDTSVFPFADNKIYINYLVDGEHGGEQGSVLCARTGLQYDHQWTFKGAVVRTAKGLVKHAMLFSELDIEEGERDESLVGKLGELGTVRVKLYRAEIEHIPAAKAKPKARSKVISTTVPRRLPKGKSTKMMETPPSEVSEPDPMPLLPTGQVPEKNVKGLAMSHQTTLGPAVPLYATESMSDSEENGCEDMPLRRVEAPPPQPTTRETELVNSQQKVQDIQKEIKKEVKRERDTSEDVDGDEGMEVVEHRNKKICQTGGRGGRKDVIDLCSDD